ncbi:phage portal protein [Gemmata sp. G18]|uniref:Phage portal protein n=1 Tax=Gemmata palustris TaxID=2822762 RepID=A0ABS5BWF0_9BACT|nr:phage portal protein [Gemmata palustris]MBP3957732.1 phage portal protein [Gemmata palustris]
MFDWLNNGVPSVKAPRGATLTAAIGPGSTGGSSPTWNDNDTRRHLAEWVYAAVRATSQRIAAQPIKVGRKQKNAKNRPSGAKSTGSRNPAASGSDVKEAPEHPLHDILDQPNPYLTESTLISLIVASLEVTGTAFLWFDEQESGNPRLWYLPTGWVREDPDYVGLPLTRFIVRAENSTDEYRLGSAELIRMSYPDPANPFQSLSPLKAAFRSVLADEQILDSQVTSFRNGGRPGLLVKVGQDASGSGIGDQDDSPALTATQRRVLTQRIKEATSGAANAGEPIILDAIIKEVTRISNTPAEMDFTASSLLTRDRVLAAFGTPKVSLGMTDDANRASAVVSDETFCFSKCAPICRLISDHLTNFFRVVYEDASLVVWLEPPRPRDPDGRRADLQQLIGAGAIKVNELRAEHGLPADPDGDVWVKSGPAPVEQKPDPAEPKPNPDPPKGVRTWDLLSEAERRNVFARNAAHRSGRPISLE